MPISKELLLSIKSGDYNDKKLSLENQEITTEDVTSLVEVLKNNKSIKEIDLSHNNVSDLGAQMLSSINTLESLNLTDNSITENGALVLSKSHLQKLNISANPIKDAVGAFKETTSLTELIATECEITDIAAQDLLLSKTIKKLDISSNSINGSFLRHLAKNTTLEELVLAQNPLTEECCGYFSNNTTLRCLDLTNTFIGDIGAALLSKNKSLIELILIQCSIGDAGALALSQNNTLKTLILFNNYIKDIGIMHLAKNNSFTHLNLQNNPFTVNAITYIKQRYIQCFGDVFTRTEKFITELLKKNEETTFTPVFNAHQKDTPQNPQKFTIDQLAATIVEDPRLTMLFAEQNKEQVETFLNALRQHILEIPQKSRKKDAEFPI